MAKLLMISGDRSLAEGKHGAFYNTLEEFHKHWDRVDIICPRVKSEELKVKNLFGNVFIHPSPWPILFQPFWILKKGKELFCTLHFSLFTCHDFPPFYNGIGARFLWQKVRVPYILEFHHIPGYPKAANFKEKIYANKFLWRLYWSIFGSKASAVRVVNQKQTPEFLKKVGVPEDKIIYIPSMYIDLDVFKPQMATDQSEEISGKNQWQSVKKYDLIFVGRLEKNKGLDLLLETANKLKAQILNFKMIIVGKGSLEGFLKFKIKKLKLRDNVLFYGRAKDSQEIAKLLNQSNALIMPSYNEGGPRVVLEAMACGVPILATNVGLMPDLADKNAVKIIDWDVGDITRKTKELLRDEEERSRLSAAGLEIAKQFEKEKMIKNYTDKLKSYANMRM